MSASSSVTAGVSKVAGAGRAHAAQAHDKAGADAGGGFASLLLGMGGDESSSPSLAGEACNSNSDAKATPAAAEAPLPPDAAQAAAQTQIQAQSAPAAAQSAGKDERAASELRDAAKRLTPTRVAPGLQAAASDGASGAGAASLAQAAQTTQAAASDADPEFQPLLKQAALVQKAAQRLQQTQQDVASGSEQNSRETRVDVAARQQLEAAAMQTLRAEKDPAVLQALAGAQSGLTARDSRQEKDSARASAVGDAASGWGVWVHPADAPRLDAPAVAADPNLMTQNNVAEQVSHFVLRGVRSADVQVDGLAGGAVKVSIAVQGQEARVDFSADQAQARQLLQESVPQLRELLANEGLTLAGVSVGGSDAGGAGRQAPQPRDGARQVQVIASPELAGGADLGLRARAGSGRALDLFV